MRIPDWEEVIKQVEYDPEIGAAILDKEEAESVVKALQQARDTLQIFSALATSHNAQLEYIRKLEAVVEAAKLFADAEKGWGSVPTKLKLALDALEVTG